MNDLIQSEFRFTQPCVVKMEYKKHDITDDRREEIPIALETKVFPVDESQNSAKIQLKVKIGGDPAIHPFAIVVVMEALFNWDDSFDEIQLRSLIHGNAGSLLYGYARQIVSFMTSNSGYPVLHLPFADFSAMID